MHALVNDRPKALGPTRFGALGSSSVFGFCCVSVRVTRPLGIRRLPIPGEITPTPTPPGLREGQKQMGTGYPERRSKTRFALGYYRIAPTGFSLRWCAKVGIARIERS